MFGAGKVSRVAGVDRYATAVAISQAYFSPGVPAVFLATGTNFPDALAGSAVAGLVEGPVLLTTPTSLPAAVASEITRLAPSKVYILGGTGVVSAAIEAQLAGQFGAGKVVLRAAPAGTTDGAEVACRQNCPTGAEQELSMAVPNSEGIEKLEDAIVRAAETTAANVRTAKNVISTVIFGQEQVVERALMTVLCGGHALLVGLPGLAKTKLVETMGIALGLDARRVQFTPDLMPSDILGSEVLEEDQGGRRTFRFIPGPVFTQLLMADEINRASPRTQSALLQAMQELHVTVAGARHDLPRPFHVLATQNPIEQEGTYSLPEAQLDRFLMQIDVDYPDLDSERRIVFDTTGMEESKPKATMTADELLAAQRLVRRLPVGESVVEAILRLVRSARPGPEGGDTGKLISWGPGPRASQALMLAVRARALLEGRFAPSVDDVLELAEPVLKHRMALTFAARAEGETIPNVIGRLKARIG